MRASQVVLSAIGVLLAATLGAQPAPGQERTERAWWERAAAARASGEDRHEARRRAAAERREAVLEWHRARRAGLDPRGAASVGVPPSALARGAAGDAAVLPAAAGRTPRAGREPEPGLGEAAVVPVGAARWSGAEGQPQPASPAAASATWRLGRPDARWKHDPWWEQDAWWGQDVWWDEPWWGCWGVPGHGRDAWRGPFGFRELVCVTHVREGRWAEFPPFDPGYGGARRWKRHRADGGLRLHARCRPALPIAPGFALPHAFTPGFRDPFAPFGVGPWLGRPVPHRFHRRFHPPAELPPRWGGEAGWFVVDPEDMPYW
jgi:hypothetical protein